MDQLNSPKDDAIALATLGVIAASKALSMASLGIFRGASPIPPTPSGSSINSSPMLSTIGKLM